MQVLKANNTNGGGDNSVGRASNWKAKRNTDAGSSPLRSKGFSSHCQLPAQALLWCPYSPYVQTLAST